MDEFDPKLLHDGGGEIFGRGNSDGSSFKNKFNNFQPFKNDNGHGFCEGYGYGFGCFNDKNDPLGMKPQHTYYSNKDAFLFKRLKVSGGGIGYGYTWSEGYGDGFVDGSGFGYGFNYGKGNADGTGEG